MAWDFADEVVPGVLKMFKHRIDSARIFNYKKFRVAEFLIRLNPDDVDLQHQDDPINVIWMLIGFTAGDYVGLVPPEYRGKLKLPFFNKPFNAYSCKEHDGIPTDSSPLNRARRCVEKAFDDFYSDQARYTATDNDSSLQPLSPSIPYVMSLSDLK